MHALPDTRTPQATPSAPTLRAWEQLAQRARHCMQTGQLECTLAIQVKALQMARRLLASPLLHTHTEHCLAAWVVSHHNIADLLAQRQQLPLAVDFLCDAHRGLVQFAHADDSTSALQQAAWRHLRETHGALLQWQRRHGSTPAMETALRAAGHPGLAPAGVMPRTLALLH